MQKKKPYNKPEISRVELQPEDAVLTACKHMSTGPNKSRWCGPQRTYCGRRKVGS